jgi:hypothetical protein
VVEPAILVEKCACAAFYGVVAAHVTENTFITAAGWPLYVCGDMNGEKLSYVREESRYGGGRRVGHVGILKDDGGKLWVAFKTFQDPMVLCGCLGVMLSCGHGTELRMSCTVGGDVCRNAHVGEAKSPRQRLLWPGRWRGGEPSARRGRQA